jgi:hypothetical protein
MKKTWTQHVTFCLRKTELVTSRIVDISLVQCAYLPFLMTYKYSVLLHNGGFFNTCIMKRCLHRNVDFKTNALNNAHVSQLVHYKAVLLQNECIIIQLQIKTNT